MVDAELLRDTRHVHVSSFFLQDALVPGLPALFDIAARPARRRPSIRTGTRRSGGTVGCSTCSRGPTCSSRTRRRRGASPASTTSPRPPGAWRGDGHRRGEGGDEGALAVHADAEPVFASARPIDLVDTTGAGDSFDAGFLAASLEGRQLPEALAFAAACGALSTRASGGVDAQPTRDEAEAFLRQGVPA